MNDKQIGAKFLKNAKSHNREKGNFMNRQILEGLALNKEGLWTLLEGKNPRGGKRSDAELT